MTITNDDKLIAAALQGDINTLKTLIPQTNQTIRTIALEGACQGGHEKCVVLLLSCIDDTSNLKLAAKSCAQRGRVACLKHIIAASPTTNYTYALLEAAYGGHVGCINLLTLVVDPLEDKGAAIAAAAYVGQTKCVRSLLNFGDDNHNGALASACIAGNFDCMDLLLDNSDSVRVLFELQHNHNCPQAHWERLEHAIAQRQQQVLVEHIVEQETKPLPRKI